MKIRKKSVIDIISASSKPNSESFEHIKDYIVSLGFVPRIAADIISEDEPFYSNSNLYRATAFKNALLALDSDIIWFLRGGRGATEIIDYLEGHFKNFAKLPELGNLNKLLIGFSDVTALHSYVIKNYGLVTLHGDMLERIVGKIANESSVKKLEDLIQDGTNTPIIYELAKLSPKEVNTINGKVLGGNLTLVESIIGTDYDVDYSDSFLLLEDVNMHPTAIVRSITHLVDSHKLDKVKALIFADFITDTEENEQYVQWVQNEFLSKLYLLSSLPEDITVFVLDGIGHNPVNNPIFLNSESVIYKENDKYFIKVSNPIEIIEV